MTTGSSPMDTLPRIVSVATRLATYDVPRIFFVGTQRREIRRAFEITVHTASPIRGGALSPVLWLGDTPVAEMAVIGRNQYRFYAIEPTQLRDGAAIAFGWSEPRPSRAGQPAAPLRLATRYRLRLGGPSIA